MIGTLSLRGEDPGMDNCVRWDTDDRQSLALGAAVWDESARAGFAFFDGESCVCLTPERVGAGFDPATIPRETVIVAMLPRASVGEL